MGDISSADKLIAGVSKQNCNNRRFLLCLFPEMYFHSLRRVHTGLSVHTHFHCRMNRFTRTDEIQQVIWSFLFLFLWKIQMIHR